MAEVIEAYKDYSPPCNARATIEELLETVPHEHLAGLWRVVLTNATALSGPRKRRWSWSRGKKVRHQHEVAGLYHAEHRGDPAWIELFVDKVVEGTPALLLRLRFARGILFGGVLFHELGHHIHRRHAPEHRETEDVADDWMRRLGRSYAWRRHPITTALIQPAVWIWRPFFRQRRRKT